MSITTQSNNKHKKVYMHTKKAVHIYCLYTPFWYNLATHSPGLHCNGFQHCNASHTFVLVPDKQFIFFLIKLSFILKL